MFFERGKYKGVARYTYYHQLDPFLIPPFAKGFGLSWPFLAYAGLAAAGLAAVFFIRKKRPFWPGKTFGDLAVYGIIGAALMQIIGANGLRWYSMAYIAGAFSAGPAAFYLIKKGRVFFSKKSVWDIVIYGALGGSLGGRLGFCLFYRQDLFWSFDGSFPFWGLLKAHEGGMSSHGGILGVLLAMWLCSRAHKASFFSLMDLAAIGGAAGIFLGRIANFINGELFGRVIKGKALWGVKFPGELHLWAERAPEYQERLLSLKPLLPVLKAMPGQTGVPGGYEWESWILKGGESALYQVSRICGLIAGMAGRPEVKEALEPLLSLRHPSQLYQSFLGGLAPFLILCFVWRRPRKAGIVSLIWFASYSALRIASEFFRMPDASLGYRLFHLTQGQWLSLTALLTAGSAYGWLVWQKAPKGFHAAGGGPEPSPGRRSKKSRRG